MLTANNFDDLKNKGYTVVSNVITPDECDEAIRVYREWLLQFRGKFPKNYQGIIRGFNIGHMEMTWRLRLKTKPVFAQLWKTEKLLTSFDGIAIGRPPEDGQEKFQEPGDYWLHTDQNADRIGLHAYQGALYLEEQCEDDWTLQVMEGTHKHRAEFFETFKQAATRLRGHSRFKEEELDFFLNKGCRELRIPVPKGGMALWDSELIHANARPLKNRQNPGRWRFVTFVSMTPAIWASSEDLADHKKAYEEAKMTTHWSSKEIRLHDSKGEMHIFSPTVVPDIAKTDEARRLSGDLPYDFKDCLPNGSEYVPLWRNERIQNKKL